MLNLLLIPAAVTAAWAIAAAADGRRVYAFDAVAVTLISCAAWGAIVVCGLALEALIQWVL